jgi:hypothetical protein
VRVAQQAVLDVEGASSVIAAHGQQDIRGLGGELDLGVDRVVPERDHRDEPRGLPFGQVDGLGDVAELPASCVELAEHVGGDGVAELSAGLGE